MHVMVKTVLSYKATVEAAPESVFPLKLPSGLVTVHETAFLELQ